MTRLVGMGVEAGCAIRSSTTIPIAMGVEAIRIGCNSRWGAASTFSSLPWNKPSVSLTPRAALPVLVRSETTTALESKFVALWPTFPLSYLLPQGVRVQVAQKDH